MTESVTASIITGASSPTIAIVLGVIGGALLVIFLVLCWCRFRARGLYDSKMSTVQSKNSAAGPQSPSDLIPPLFYTPEMRDPLLQEDLKDNFRSSNRSIYI
jgi:hypothetical protein